MRIAKNTALLSLCAVILAGAAMLAPCDAGASNKDKNWERGCADAKAGSYDRSKHGKAYEEGWQACKQQAAAPAPSSRGSEWDRGCSDAKVGSYDRSKHSDAYEQGWQACKPN